MPMMKTASVGTTTITNIQKYLMNAQQQAQSARLQEREDFLVGGGELSVKQVGGLRAYLGQESRGLAVDTSDDLTVRNWANQMDLTRFLYQHDKPTKQGRSRSYYHFVLSPDPEDGCTVETMRSYAKAWCEENFRSGNRLHEYAVVYHDDNENGFLHAHVVVNVSNKKTGKKLHLDNEETVALELSAQEIGRRFGLTPIRGEMQKAIGARTTQPIFLDRKEREILNKGGYSWKWELRKFVLDIAPLCNDFDDFKWKLNRAGYDVRRSGKQNYLTYTHKNGLQVKDSRLGSRFYMESLESVFNHEYVLADQAYSSWELIKISKGQVPWKEEIRRAIDSVAPTVLTIPELQRELNAMYGIRLTVNRRGITYHHASGFKTRDVGLGLRYTIEGLRRNAVVETLLPYPAYGEIELNAGSLARHYMPRSMRGLDRSASELVAARAVYRDVCGLMVKYGLSRIEDIPDALKGRYEALRDEKKDLMGIRSQVIKWNRLVVLQSRSEKDAAFLVDPNNGSDPALHNETLLRFERVSLYLKEQTGGVDPRSMQKEISALYQERLESYQSQLSALDQDSVAYQNYLVGQSFSFVDEFEPDASFGASSLVSASQTLSKHRIRDFFHLEQTLSEYETRLDLAKYKLSKEEEKRRSLESIRNDMRTFEELKPILPTSDALQKSPIHLGIEVQMLRYQEASRRLSNAGIEEDRFTDFKREYCQVMQACGKMRKECDRLSIEYAELKQAQKVCQEVAESIKNVHGFNHVSERKPSSGGGEEVVVSKDWNAMAASASNGEMKEQAVEPVSDLPIGEARKRNQDRLRNAPERSKRHREDWTR